MSDASKTERELEQARKMFHRLLEETVGRGASDLFLKTGSAPALRLKGEVGFMKREPITGQFMEQVAAVILGPKAAEFKKTGEVDLAYQKEEVGRFRVNMFRQRGEVSAAFRHIPLRIPSFEELSLPVEQLAHLAQQTRGIILVTGVTGSGKSTTLAAMVDYMNARFGRHIVTIEDPVEFVHDDKKCLIEQREVGVDTVSFQEALRHAVRQSPDVILIGEMRDRVTIETALNAAEIGHLVMSTLHTGTAVQTLERMVSYFPPHQHDLIRTQVSNTIQGVLSQRLLRRKDGSGRVPAIEVMMRSPTNCDLIAKNQVLRLREAMREDAYYGNQTYNEALVRLCRSDQVSIEEAMAASDKAHELKNALQGIRTGTGTDEGASPRQS